MKTVTYVPGTFVTLVSGPYTPFPKGEIRSTLETALLAEHCRSGRENSLWRAPNLGGCYSNRKDASVPLTAPLSDGLFKVPLNLRSLMS